MKKLLTVVTRTCDRPLLLGKNKESVEMQTDPAYTHLILEDKEARGLEFANGLLSKHKRKVKGEYVYILDDDNCLTITDLVAGLRIIVEEHKPDVIMVKSFLSRHGVMPRFWGQRPRLCQVDTTNFIVKRSLWKAHIKAFHQPIYGDFHFIDAIFDQPGLKVVWWDRVVAKDMR